MTHYAFIYREGKYYVAKSVIGIASQGETIEEAKKNLQEALELYYEDHSEDNYSESFITSFELSNKASTVHA